VIATEMRFWLRGAVRKLGLAGDLWKMAAGTGNIPPAEKKLLCKSIVTRI
jgi:hypothetical protein